MLVVLGYAAYTFALGGLAAWMPAFLERVRGVPKASAATDFGVIVVVDRNRRHLGWGLAGGLSAEPLAPGVPVAVGRDDAARRPGGFYRPDRRTRARLYLPAIVVAELLLFMSTGPVNAAIVNIVSPLERASAGALTMFVIHLLGDVPSPVLIGHLSDPWAVRPEVPSPWPAQC